MEKFYSKVSLWSQIVHFIIKLLPFKRNYLTEESTKKFIEKIKNKPHKVIKEFNLDDIIEYKKFKMPVYLYNGTIDKSKEKYLVYVHGGSYIEEANNFQLKFAKKIADKTNSTLVFAIYPLAPYATYKDMFELYLILYKKLMNKNCEINFLGDSAGGGFILSLAKLIKERGLEKPKNIIALSPWLDLSLSSETIYEDCKYDNMCAVDGSKYCGKIWASELDTKDPMISPFYANMNDIGTITIIIGTHDMLINDCKNFHERLIKEEVKHNYLVYKNQGHVFGVLPTKEGKETIKEISDIINGVGI